MILAEVKIISPFLGSINHVVFGKQVEFETVELIIMLIENKFKVEMTMKFTKHLLSIIQLIYYNSNEHIHYETIEDAFIKNITNADDIESLTFTFKHFNKKIKWFNRNLRRNNNNHYYYKL